MKRISVFSLTSLLALLLSTSLWAVNGDELLKRIDTKMMPASYEAYRTLVDSEPDGKQKIFSVYTAKKGKDKVVMLFLSPATDKGRTTLRLADNMWLAIPKLRPIRITSLQSITGSIFNNSDIMQLDYSAEYSVINVKETNSGYILQLKAKTKSVAYDNLKLWASKDEITRKIECYSASGMLIKTLDFKHDKDFGNGLIRPSVIETYSPLNKGYVSTMTYTRITPREFNDVVFTLNYMTKIDTLRR